MHWMAVSELPAQRYGPPAVCAMVVERLAMGDREHPGAQVRIAAQPRVCPHRGQECLLEAVVGILAAHGSHQEPVDVVPVFVEERLEGRH